MTETPRRGVTTSEQPQHEPPPFPHPPRCIKNTSRRQQCSLENHRHRGDDGVGVRFLQRQINDWWSRDGQIDSQKHLVLMRRRIKPEPNTWSEQRLFLSFMTLDGFQLKALGTLTSPAGRVSKWFLFLLQRVSDILYNSSPIPAMQSHNRWEMTPAYLSRCSENILELLGNSSAAEQGGETIQVTQCKKNQKKTTLATRRQTCTLYDGSLRYWSTAVSGHILHTFLRRNNYFSWCGCQYYIHIP